MNSTFVVLSRAVSIIGGVLFSISVAVAQVPLPGPNVNMVTGTHWPAGDPFLTKQNETSVAVSSVNAQHLLAGANDYRLVDPFFTGGTEGGDAWVTVYKSVNGGITWRTSVIPGCPFNITECNNPASPVKGLQFAADPTVRPGPYGTFFYSFIAGNRNTSAGSVTAIERFVDHNNNVKAGDDPFTTDYINIIDTGTVGQFKDKTWHIADAPGRLWNTSTCIIPGYNVDPATGIEKAVPAFSVYMSYSNFVGQADNNPHPQILVARSTDCGQTFGNSVKVSQSIDTNQGSVAVVDPQTGALFVLWRRVADPSAGTGDAIYMNTSRDGGNKWDNATLVASIIPFDQGSSLVSFRTLAFPAATISVDSSGQSRLHVAWAQRQGSATADARIMMQTAKIDSNGNLLAWGTPALLDNWSSDPNNPVNIAHPENFNPANPGRGHQFQPALSFAGGKLMAIWYDQRLDQTFGYMDCSGLTAPYSLSQCIERRQPVANLAAQPPQVNTVFWQYLADVTPPGQPALTRRHTIDVFAAMADLSVNPDGTFKFTSNRVSQYQFGNKKLAMKGTTKVQQLRFNVPNLPIFAKDSLAFIGDYLDVAAQTMMATGQPVPTAGVFDSTGHTQAYNFNCGPFPDPAHPAPPFCSPNGSKPLFHAAWTDNRDIVKTTAKNADGSWVHTPISTICTNGTATYSTPGGVTSGQCTCPPGTTTCTVLNAFTGSGCVPGQDGSRNQNIYTALLSENAAGFTAINSKKLNATTPRTFVVGVQNLDDVPNSYILTIAPQPPGGTATFVKNSNPLVTTLGLKVPPRSSSWRTVWVTSSSPGASVTVNVCAASSLSPLTPLTCDQSAGPLTQLPLNPDPRATLNLNAAVTTQDIASLDATDVSVKTQDITNLDITSQDIASLDLASLDLASQDITSQDIASLDIASLDIASQDITSLDITSLDIASLDIASLDIASNSFQNLDLTSSAVADATFTVQNTYVSSPDGGSNTDATVDVKTLLRDQKIPDGYKMQLVLRKVVVKPTPVNTCRIGLVQQSTQLTNLSTPNVANPDDPSLGQFDQTTDPTAATPAGTLPLLPGERGYITLRILKKTNCTTPNTCDAGDPGGSQAVAFGQTGEKFVDIGAGGTTTPVALIIKTLSLQPVIVHKTATLTVQSFGGTGPFAWTGVSLPPWVTLTPSTTSTVTLNINKPPSTGTFTLILKVVDSSNVNSSNPQQTDTQSLSLVVTTNNP